MRSVIILTAVVALLTFSCRKEPLTPQQSTASISVNIGVKINSWDNNRIQKSGQAIEDYHVIIEDINGAIVLEYTRAADMPETIELAPGTYVVIAHSGNLMDAAFDSPYYYGQSNEILLEQGDNEVISLICSVHNCAVSVAYSENIISNFISWSTIVSNSGGSLVFDATETRLGYFSLLPLTIESVLTYTLPDNSSATITLTGNIELPEPQKHYEVLIDALPDQTGLAISLVEDNTLNSHVIMLTDGSTAQQPASGDIIISEIMADPDALSDTDGEYIELYNTTENVLSLKGLLFKQNGSDVFIIDEDLFIGVNGYFTIARSTSVSFTPGYIPGSMSLPNSGAELAFYMQNNEIETEICTLNYGAENFPQGKGASIELSENHMNAADAVTGSNWCVSVSQMGDGDLGTPGLTNSCN